MDSERAIHERVFDFGDGDYIKVSLVPNQVERDDLWTNEIGIALKPHEFNCDFFEPALFGFIHTLTNVSQALPQLLSEDAFDQAVCQSFREIQEQAAELLDEGDVITFDAASSSLRLIDVLRGIDRGYFVFEEIDNGIFGPDHLLHGMKDGKKHHIELDDDQADRLHQWIRWDYPVWKVNEPGKIILKHPKLMSKDKPFLDEF